MTYEHTVDYLFSQLPNYQQQGKTAYKADIGNIVSFCKRLGDPQKKLQCIHLAGTNGKGSVAHIIAAALQASGHKVGIYSSPHLLDFRERIKINGEYISKEKVVDFVSTHTDYCEKNELSFFEWTTALAFEYFCEQSVDLAIIETGLGGRLDSTNVIQPILAIITTIGMDHMDLLGNSLESIAHEKAGIIKKETPVLIGTVDPSLHHIFQTKAKELSAPIYFTDQHIDFRAESDLKPGYQKTNLSIAHAACKLLEQVGWTTDFSNGIKHVAATTGLLGRWQIVETNPLTILDCAHNEDGIRYAAQELEQTEGKVHIVFGTVKDKAHGEILELLPKKACYYFCTSTNHRSMDAAELQEMAAKHDLQGAFHLTVEAAIRAAQAEAQPNDTIYIGGSTFVVADSLLVF